VASQVECARQVLNITIMNKIILPFTLLFLCCSWASAESSVWKAQKGKSVIYLGGTCHLLRPTDFPLPAEFDKAYKASEILVFETDLGKLQDPALQQTLMTKGMYSDGSTVDKHLSPQTFATLSKYCASKGVPIDALKIFKPSLIVLTLTMMELTKLGVTQEGVDLFFYNLAIKDKKTVNKLETVEEQLNMLMALGEGNEDEFITHSISEMNETQELYKNLVDAWKKGDDKKLSDLLIKDMKAESPKIYKKLLTERNNNWLPVINNYAMTPPVEFILVGLAHLVGPDGIILSLQKQGYVITKL